MDALAIAAETRLNFRRITVRLPKTAAGVIPPAIFDEANHILQRETRRFHVETLAVFPTGAQAVQASCPDPCERIPSAPGTPDSPRPLKSAPAVYAGKHRQSSNRNQDALREFGRTDQMALAAYPIAGLSGARTPE